VDPTTRQPVKPQTRGMSAVVDGELWIGGPAIAQGYLGNATMTSSRFVDAPSGHSGTGGKYFATGDMVRLDGEGVLTHMGRVDDQINLGGLRIEPGEVENAVIHAARARGIPTDKVVVVARGLELCACISPPISQEACLQLQKDVIATLPPYHVPTLWLSLVAMPTTWTRKC
jgi:acyl-CoA synthetase (AMP-forming)/AMP-acid ligase II